MTFNLGQIVFINAALIMGQMKYVSMELWEWMYNWEVWHHKK